MKSHHSSVALGALALSLVTGCGLENSLVGGRCRDGMQPQGNTCVATEPGVTVIAPTDPPGTVSGIFTPEATRPWNPFQIDPSRPPPKDPAEPVRPHDPPVPPAPPVPPELVCDAPLVACRGACIPVDRDAASCGACGKICPSNICIAGECQGKTPGDVVLIGHDYTNAWAGSAQSKVLVNALSIPTTDPIRVLSYEDGASSSAVAQAKALAHDGIYGRKVQFTVAPSASALGSDALARSYDIVLIHDASAGDPLAVGAGWADSLGMFTLKGGVVVALDNGLSPMPELLTSSGLLAVDSHTLLPDGMHLAVTEAADVVGAQVLSPYAGFGPSVSFQGIAAPSEDLGWVVRVMGADASREGPGSLMDKKNAEAFLGDPVVVHRVVR